MTVIFLCFLIIMAEGYDLIAYGTVLPILLKTHAWGLTAGPAGFIGSASLVGMLIGALASGALADRLGRRWSIIGGTAWFSAGMAVNALPGGVTQFGVARFVVGLGIGTVIAGAAAITVEFAPRGRSQFYSALTWIGSAAGVLVGVVLGLLLLPRFGPNAMFWAGAVPLVTLVPALLVLLPESPALLLVRGRPGEAQAVLDKYRFDAPLPAVSDATAAEKRRGMLALFTGSRAAATIAFGLLGALVQLVIYGLSARLPVLTQGSGHSASTSLVFLLMLAAGCIVIPLVGSRVADRIGPRIVTSVVLLTAAISMVLLTAGLPLAPLLLLAFVAGGGTSGALVLIYGWVASFYPTTCRAAGIPWLAGLGRVGAIVGPVLAGLILAGGAKPGTVLVVFAAVAAVAMICAILIRGRAPQEVAAGAHVTLSTEKAV